MSCGKFYLYHKYALSCYLSKFLHNRNEIFTLAFWNTQRKDTRQLDTTQIIKNNIQFQHISEVLMTKILFLYLDFSDIFMLLPGYYSIVQIGDLHSINNCIFLKRIVLLRSWVKIMNFIYTKKNFRRYDFAFNSVEKNKHHKIIFPRAS